ncbi:MAG: DUF58 domain-containing protein [Bacteroidia bacterium]|nr:DUF58 domain-containing protein [Bacteroidia bacterium]
MKRSLTAGLVGEYRSAFRGSGLEFEEVRPYQYGDDVRSIDWNVTAKTSIPHVKIYREERELNTFFLFDSSSSMDFGVGVEQKRKVAIEITALLGLCVIANNDNFGLVAFTDNVEYYTFPKKGRNHWLSVVHTLFRLEAELRKTNLKKTLQFVRGLRMRRSVVFIVSDFLDSEYANELYPLSRAHQVVMIRLYHPAESPQNFPGYVPVYDLESRKAEWLSPWRSRRAFKRFSDMDAELSDLARRLKIDYLSVNVAQSYMPALESLFAKRKQTSKLT